MAGLELSEKVQTLLGGKLISVRESVPASGPTSGQTSGPTPGLASGLASGQSEPEFRTTPEHVLDVLSALKNLEGGGFDHLQDLTAYDESPKTPRFHMVYVLISMLRKQRCMVVVALDDENPAVPTATSLWKGANWLEREVYDMYGVQFVGHPDPRRILMHDTFKGYPLRKDFLVDFRQQYPQTAETGGGWDPFGTTVIKKAGDQ